MNKQKISELFARLAANNPKPTTELEYSSAFELLVAVTLSAQATDKGVNRATRLLFPQANTPQAIAALGVEGLSHYIRTIGLFNSKAKNIIATCQLLIEQHGGEVPRTREALEALPGVGRKTANVILNTAFGEPTIAVDTHIFRVANRTGLAKGATVLAVEKKLLKVVPGEYMLDAHHWLILHGRYTCIARKPKCPECVIRDLCEYRQKTPEPEPKAAGKPPLHQLIADADTASGTTVRPSRKSKTQSESTRRTSSAANSKARPTAKPPRAR
jgi:endonuclease-3